MTKNGPLFLGTRISNSPPILVALVTASKFDNPISGPLITEN